MNQTLNKLAYPVVIAHRGFRSAYPENTLVAFQAAFDAGVQMIELDVTLSRDRHPVVIHDDRLDRTTDGRGRVQNRGLEELKQLDAGEWFDSRFHGERIPTLQEVLERFGTRGIINIEIKPAPFEAEPTPDAIENQVVDLVNRYQLDRRVIISSFEVGYLERLNQLASSPALALLTDRARFETVRQTCLRLGLFSWHPGHRELKPEQVEHMHAHAIKVVPYTVNHQRDMVRVLEMGVDGFFTDDPHVAFDIIRARST